MALPDFVVIGAMKCGTSTLHEQLAAQPGVFMSTPKEPNFFGDDATYARGLPWYEALFADAAPGSLKGESSTHYTKLPTYPHCAERMAATLPDARLVYVIRDPFARLVSHYIHEWTMGVMSGGLDAALERHPELVSYSRYAMQIRPYLDRYGVERIFLTSLEALSVKPDDEFERLGRFLGAPRPFVWNAAHGAANVSTDRLRRFPLYDLIVANPTVAALRRAFVPQALRDAVKNRLRMKHRPVLSNATRARLAPVFAEDHSVLLAAFPDFRWPTV